MAFKSKKLILFSSGSGTNVQNICEYFQGADNVDIVLVAGNNKQAQTSSERDTKKVQQS